jgi:hypothetical protein
MSIDESIKRQAELIKNPDARLKLAAQFEEMAKTLRGDAPAKPMKFAEIFGDKKTKLSRAERFGAAMAAGRAADAVTALRAAGWSMLGTGKEDPQKWGMKGKPGLQLRISGNSFEIFQGDDNIQPKTELSLMKNYLSPGKGGSVTANPSNL